MATNSKDLRYHVMPTGAKMPMVGLGLWKGDADVVESVVVQALKNGYRHFDNASDYQNQKGVGRALKSCIEKGTVKREDLWITSKLWNTDHHPGSVKLACQNTLAELEVDYLDLYLIHFPVAFEYRRNEKAHHGWDLDENGVVKLDHSISLRDTWQAMEKLVEEGLVKHIGISNFSASLILDLLSYAKIKPVVNQIEVHPYLSQQRLVKFCQRMGIAVTAFSPFGGASYVELGSEVAKKVPSLFEHEDIVRIAHRHKVNPSQVLLRWGLQRGLSIIPKSVHTSRLAQNIDLYDFTLTSEDMEVINGLNRNLRFNDVDGLWGVPLHNYEPCPLNLQN